MQALWQMHAGTLGVSDPYPDQLFEADLTAGYYYRPLPPYFDPAVSFGAGSLGDPYVNVANGTLTWAATDYSLGGRGPVTTLARTYNSGDGRDGPFGFGWSLPYAMGLQENADGSVTVANFDGRRDYYTKSGSTYTAPAGTETTLVENPDSSWTLTYRDHTAKSFDAAGKLTAVRDADGNATALAYTSGRLSTITDAVGRVFTLSYDANGRVSGISLPLSRSLAYGYDAAGNLTSYTDAAGKVTSYAYASDHRLSTVTDPSGRVTTFAWTTARRVKSRTDDFGATTSYAYTSAGAGGGTTTATDPRGTQTIHTFDARHRQTRLEVVVPGASNLVTLLAYDGDDQLTQATTRAGWSPPSPTTPRAT